MAVLERFLERVPELKTGGAFEGIGWPTTVCIILIIFSNFVYIFWFRIPVGVDHIPTNSILIGTIVWGLEAPGAPWRIPVAAVGLRLVESILIDKIFRRWGLEVPERRRGRRPVAAAGIMPTKGMAIGKIFRRWGLEVPERRRIPVAAVGIMPTKSMAIGKIFRRWVLEVPVGLWKTSAEKRAGPAAAVDHRLIQSILIDKILHRWVLRATEMERRPEWVLGVRERRRIPAAAVYIMLIKSVFIGNTVLWWVLEAPGGVWRMTVAAVGLGLTESFLIDRIVRR